MVIVIVVDHAEPNIRPATGNGAQFGADSPESRDLGGDSGHARAGAYVPCCDLGTAIDAYAADLTSSEKGPSQRSTRR